MSIREAQEFMRLAERYVRARRPWLVMPEPPTAKPIPKSPPSPLIRSKDARVMLGGRGLLDRCEKAGWLKPVQRGKRMTLYRRKDILAALQRIEWGELG
jgi:hypothetical protein